MHTKTHSHWDDINTDMLPQNYVKCQRWASMRDTWDNLHEKKINNNKNHNHKKLKLPEGARISLRPGNKMSQTHTHTYSFVRMKSKKKWKKNLCLYGANLWLTNISNLIPCLLHFENIGSRKRKENRLWIIIYENPQKKDSNLFSKK